VLQVNDAFCKMLGYTAKELLTMNAAQWDTQWTAAQIKENIASLRDAAVMLETRHRRRDGSIIDVEVSVVKGWMSTVSRWCTARRATSPSANTRNGR
jgi:PAS domain S-box-containing protein